MEAQPAYASSQALLKVPVEGTSADGLKASKPIWAATSILTLSGRKTSILSTLGPAEHFLRGQGGKNALRFCCQWKWVESWLLPHCGGYPGRHPGCHGASVCSAVAEISAPVPAKHHWRGAYFHDYGGYSCINSVGEHSRWPGIWCLQRSSGNSLLMHQSRQFNVI